MIDFTIGCDCELVISENNRILVSSDYVETTDAFGADGDGTVFEIRPGYSKCPLELVRKINKTMKNFLDKNSSFSSLKWEAGSIALGRSIGGHIHFGTSNLLSREVSGFFLGNYLAPIYYLIENKNKIIERNNIGYGLFNDTRPQSHGFEYRALGSWITSPYVSSAILCLAKAIISECLNNDKFVNSESNNLQDFLP